MIIKVKQQVILQKKNQFHINLKKKNPRKKNLLPILEEHKSQVKSIQNK